MRAAGRSCVCGAVTFEVAGELAPPDACHCSQCRKQSGHLWASAHVPDQDLFAELVLQLVQAYLSAICPDAQHIGKIINRYHVPEP